MNERGRGVVLAGVMLLFGWGALGIAAYSITFSTGGTSSDAIWSALVGLGVLGAFTGAILCLKRFGLLPERKHDQIELPAPGKWFTYPFYWVLIAPLILIITFDLLTYPAALVAQGVWGDAPPLPIQVGLGAIRLFAFATAAIAVWWIWRRYRAFVASFPRAAERN